MGSGREISLGLRVGRAGGMELTSFFDHMGNSTEMFITS